MFAEVDDEVFVQLYVRARRVAARIAGREAAPDLAAEIMVRALTSWHRIAPYAERWVTVSATNLAIDSLRAQRPRLESPLERPIDDVAATRVTVSASLRRLSKRQRQVVVLRHLVGLPEAEIAATLGLSLGTVKTHLARAMAALRRQNSVETLEAPVVP